jgi:hypothetical protein
MTPQVTARVTAEITAQVAAALTRYRTTEAGRAALKEPERES